jgi:hypothetical protein
MLIEMIVTNVLIVLKALNLIEMSWLEIVYIPLVINGVLGIINGILKGALEVSNGTVKEDN